MSQAIVRTLALAGVVALAAPAAVRAEGEVTFGGQAWTQTAREALYQQYRDLPRGGFLESFILREWNGTTGVTLFGANGLKDDQSTSLRAAFGSRLRFDVDYGQIPHLFSLVARSPYSEIAPGVLSLPDTLQRTNQENPGAYVSTMRDLLNSAPGAQLDFRTDVTTARVRSRPAAGWQVEARGTRRMRSGTKPYGMAFGFSNVVEVVEPIDQEMLDGDVIGSYEKGRVRVQADLGASSFENRVNALRVDNPRRSTDRVGGDGPQTGQTDLYPDNQVMRGSVALGLQLPRRTAVSATVGVSEHRQDDDWLPYTINTAILQPDTFPLPAASADAKATILNGDLRVVSRPVEHFTGTLRVNHYKYDNKTTESTFAGQVPIDVSWTVGPFENHAFGHQRTSFGADLDYDVGTRAGVGVTLERNQREHTLREVEKDAENVYGGRVRVRPRDGVVLDGSYRRGDRKLDEFKLEDYEDAAGQLVEQAGLRRYDVADRKRDDATVGVSWLIGDRIEASARYGLLRNDYDDSPLGLQEEKQQTVTTEATLAVNERVNLSGGYGYGLANTDQASRESSGAVLVQSDTTNWGVELEDETVFVFLQADWQASEKLSLSAGYTFSRSDAVYDLSNFKNTAQDLPSVFSRLHDLHLEARYRMMDRYELAARYFFEEYDVTDFANEDVPLLSPVTGSANAVYLGDELQDYRAHRVALLATYRFP